MSLLERLLRIGFPSSNWQEDAYRRLELDLSAETLCGVPLGAEMDALSFLGVAEDRRLAHQGTLVYFRRGLVVTIRAARTAGYTAVFEPPGEGDPDYIQPFAGVVFSGARVLGLSGSATEEAVTSLFGVPQERKLYEEGSELGYERGDTVMDVKLNPEGRLASLYLGLA
ncbi:MAG: hypothetical protein M3498_02550 [Deinococcota bacterium]|nr:hypothetical protein [Deinococcota bacterium]